MKSRLGVRVHMKKLTEDKILAYIEAHLGMEYRQEDFAEAFGYSIDHFMQGVYSASGYNVGTGDMLLRVLNSGI